MPNRMQAHFFSAVTSALEPEHDFIRRRDLADQLVHIIDPDSAFCEGLAVLFRMEGYRSTFSTSAAQFLVQLELNEPQVVVSNLQLGDENGLAVLRSVRSRRRGTVFVMLTDTANIEVAVTAMKLGASDVLTKPLDSETLLNTVREGLKPSIVKSRNAQGQSVVEVRGHSTLTPREREVLNLITNGFSNKDAARELAISPRTIEVHRARVMQKLGARNTAELMRIVLTQ